MKSREDGERLPVSYVLKESGRKTERRMNSFFSFPLFFPRFAVSLQGIGSKPA